MKMIENGAVGKMKSERPKNCRTRFWVRILKCVSAPRAQMTSAIPAWRFPPHHHHNNNNNNNNNNNTYLISPLQ